MNYLELLRNEAPTKELSFMTMATTGVKRDDKIIAVFVGKESGPIMGMACENIPNEQLEATYKYHRISKPLYDNMVKVSPQVMYDSLCNFFNNDVIVSYNPNFIRNMMNNLTDTPSEHTDIIDICRVCQWVKSGQIFNTIMEANYGVLNTVMNGWRSSQTAGIKKTLQDVLPTYSEDLSKPAPESMVEALRCLCKFLEMQPVRIAQD